LREGYADLHVHTRHSDGLRSSREVVELAARAGLSWVSVTDHDTVAGLGEAQMAADRTGVGLAPAVELSVEFQDQDFHILGYWIDPEDPDLCLLLSEIRESRLRRARQITSRLHGMGVRVSFEEVQEQATGAGFLGRPHVAQALLAGGWVQSFPEAFARYLGHDAPAYVAKDPLSPARALGVLRNAGGVPVLAHPGAYQLNGAWNIFLKEGLQGIETEHPTHTRDQVAGFRRLAERYDLTQTGGSDFHGRGIGEVPIGGTRVHARVLDQLAARREHRG